MLVSAVVVSPAFAQTQGQKGAVMGGIAGSIIGGIAGHQNNETPEGIAIGGIAGAIAGGLLGKSQEQQQMRQYQYRQAQQQQVQYEVSRAVSLNDAVTMSRSGMSPNLIVSQIRASGVQQEIGVKEVIALHESGVPEVVIQEMQRARVAGSPAAVVVQQPRAVFVEPRPTVIVESYPDFHHGYYHHVPHRAHGYYHGYHR
jgi:hypothetical protein